MAERIEMTPNTAVGSTVPASSSMNAGVSGGTDGSATSGAQRAPARASRPKAKPGAGKQPKRTWRDTGWGRVLELLAYLVMLVLALVYFTGKGLFIYEGF